jgi:hypothetical protein
VAGNYLRRPLGRPLRVAVVVPTLYHGVALQSV